MPKTPTWSVLVLAGGRSQRFGQDKLSATIDGTPLLDRVLSAIPRQIHCVVVGPEPMSPPRPIVVASETVRFGGPVAAIECGLTQVSTDIVAVLAADMPFAAKVVDELAAQLAHMPGDVDALVPVDHHGRRQFLAAAYRTDALRVAVARTQPTAGARVRDVVAHLNVLRTPADSFGPVTLFDIDTYEDLELARRAADLSEDGAATWTR